MKKILFTLLSLLLFFAVAQAATNYGFYVAGTMVTSDNCNNIVNNYIKSGRVSYDPGTNTLFMHDVTINTQGASGDARRAIQNNECSDLIVMFRGTCNLTGYDGAGVRIRKSTTLWAPEATDVVNIHSVNAEGIWMATSNNFELYIQGPGTFNISSDTSTALEDEDDGSGIQLDTWHQVYFDNVNAVLSSGGNSVVKRVSLRFNAGSSVRFKATNNSSYPVINFCAWYLYGNEALLEPYGAYYDSNNSSVVDSNGNRVYNKDVYVSDDYLAIINSTNFPDANFRNYLLGLYSKGYITQTDVNNRTTMDVSGKSISNLQGIKYFTALKELRCYNNPMTSLDVSGLTALTYLDCAPTDSYTGTKLTSLNVSGCTNLETLLCYNTNISSLSVSDCTNLKKLDCHNCTRLTSLIVINKSSLNTLNCSNCTALTSLTCFNNALTSLNVTGCTALNTLKCYENANLATITGLADCTAITYLDCEDCAITSLPGVDNMTNIATLLARNNKLTTLTVTGKSKLTNLRVNGNTTLTTLQCYNNALTTLNVTGCTALKDLRCYENSNLASITGLADCKAITYLDCEDCAITSLPGVNNMTNIATLLARNNKLTTLSMNYKTNLTRIRVSGNTLLTDLVCIEMINLETLDVTNCTALKSLECYRGGLESITGLGTCTALTLLDCSDSYINNLSGLANLTNLKTLYCESNRLTSLNVQGLSKLETLYCSNNQLTTLSVQGCTALTKLYCYQNKISGSGMTTLVNSLPTRSSSNKGELRAIYNTGENNAMTAAQIATARNKYCLPKKYNGSAWVEMTASTRGDVNGDTGVNISDVTALIDYVLSGNASGIDLGAADVNQDGSINISDVTALIDHVLTGSW